MGEHLQPKFQGSERRKTDVCGVEKEAARLCNRRKFFFVVNGVVKHDLIVNRMICNEALQLWDVGSIAYNVQAMRECVLNEQKGDGLSQFLLKHATKANPCFLLGLGSGG